MLFHWLCYATHTAVQLSETNRTNILKHNQEVRKNREIILKNIDCIKFCGQYELPLRGHDEKTIRRTLVYFVGCYSS